MKLQFDKFKELVGHFIHTSDNKCANYVNFEYKRLGPDQKSKIQTKYVVKKYTPFNQKSIICNDTSVAYPFGYK